jgi:hypothetical protein
LPRRPAQISQTQDDNLTYRQVEEYVSNIGRRIPGLKTLKIEVAEDGAVSFEFQVSRIIGGKGTVR